VIRITPKNVMTTLHTSPTPDAAFCREPKSGNARERNTAASRYGIAMPSENRNNAKAPSAAEATLFGYRWNVHFVPLALHCWGIGVICAALSAPLFWLVLRRGFSLSPVSHGATAGLLAGLTGLAVLEIYCPYLDRLHISAGHIGAALTSTLVGAIVGVIKDRGAGARP